MLFSILTGTTFHKGLNSIIKDVPVIIIILPAFINLTGDLSDVFAARLTSYMYKGEIDYNFKPYGLFLVNYLAILSVAVTAFLFAAIAGNLLAGIIFHKIVNWFTLIVIVFSAGFLSTGIMSFIAALLVRFTLKHGIDPDSTISPITTTGGDFLGTTLLMLFAQLFL